MPETTRSEWVIAKTEARAERAMVVADQPLAAEAGLAVLRERGNAVDAAVTAAFVMGVVEPYTSGIGGVAAMVIRLPDGREVVIDGSSGAPRAARPDMFALDASAAPAGMYGWPGTVGNEQNVGYRSLGVPGTLACLAHALDRYGSISLGRALAPAIALAADGVEVDYYLSLTLSSYADRLWPRPESKRVFFKDGGVPYRPALGLEGADRFRQPDLARTLETVARDGPDVFYRGEIARAIVTDVRANGGLLTAEEMAAYRVREVGPLVSEYRGHRVATLPGPAGGVTLVEILNLLDGYDIAAMPQTGAASLHHIAEAVRVAFLDRLGSLGDPEHVDAALSRVTSPEYAAELRRRIRADRAGVDEAAARDVRPPADVIGGPGDAATCTTHVSVVDERRLCVSLTSTLGGGFGSGVVPRGTGVVLSNVMTWFDPRPGRPNSIAPGKRILWAVAPAVISRAGKPWLVVGAPGGRKLISAIAQAIVNALDYGDGPQDAVNRPRVHSEGAETWVDSRVTADVRAQMAAMGHQLVVKEETLSSTWFGRANAILVEDDLRAGVNRLKPSTAVGY